MDKRINTTEHTDDLIDLGAVAIETRGAVLSGTADDPINPAQKYKSGMSAD